MLRNITATITVATPAISTATSNATFAGTIWISRGGGVEKDCLLLFYKTTEREK